MQKTFDSKPTANICARVLCLLLDLQFNKCCKAQKSPKLVALNLDRMMEIGAVITCKHDTNTQYVKKHIDPSVQSELCIFKNRSSVLLS